MCITTNKASLSNTTILSIPVDNGRHFLAYSNKVKNLSGKPNAMILPIPGKTKQEWFHDTTEYKDFLKEIVKKSDIDNWCGNLSMSRGCKSFDRFNVGMYTIGLSESFEGAEEFISSLEENVRPEISDSLKEFFKKEYKGWSFAVCCFSSNEVIDSQPIAFEYEPVNSDIIFYPTMDSHDGEAPDFTERIKSDHTFIFEHSGEMKKEYEMESIQLNSQVPSILQNRKYRNSYEDGYDFNGDTFISLSEMSALEFSENPKLSKRIINTIDLSVR